MLELFTSADDSDIGLLHFPEFNYVRATYERELENLEDYYHTRVYAVKSNHLLCRMLTSFSVPFQYPTDRFVSVTEARAPQLLAAYQITSDIRYGKMFKGVFYDDSVDEIIISSNEYFNPFEVEKNWKKASPVKVILHPKTDLGLMLANGKRSMTGEGLAVISINFPMLAVQFRAFCKHQQVRANETNSMLSVSHFVHMYVLPNMVRSHLDLVIMNRLMHIHRSEPMGVSLARHSFYVINYADRIDQVLKRILQRTKNENMMYSWVLRTIPAITKENMQDVLMLPDAAPTKQIKWAMVLSRLDIIDFLIDLCGKPAYHRNQTMINSLKRSLRRLLNENILQEMIGSDLFYDKKIIIEKILDI